MSETLHLRRVEVLPAALKGAKLCHLQELQLDFGSEAHQDAIQHKQVGPVGL